MTVAAMQIAEKHVWAPRSSRMAMRRQSLMRPNMISILCRFYELFVVAAPCCSVLTWWDARRNAFLLQGGDKPVSVIPPISNQLGGVGKRRRTSARRVITHLSV